MRHQFCAVTIITTGWRRRPGSHEQGRSVAGITAADVALARLYCHAFRGHVIGTFHATRIALEENAPRPPADPWRQLAVESLTRLANQALDPMPRNFRAVISTFHAYDTSLRQAVLALERELENSRERRIEIIRDHLVRAMERITQTNGIVAVRDDVVPEQASFVVPNLGITIVPLVYGDRHCWNLAYLSGQAPDVPRHLHSEGVEIHLGYGKLHGETILGDCRAAVTEGYAMSVPAGTPHGYVNTSGSDHFLPFIFGSRRLGGWGIVLDVEPRPVDANQLAPVSAEGASMNGLVFLEREIDAAAALAVNARRTLIGREATYRPHSGALVLAVSRATPAGLAYRPGPFRIVSIARGRGLVRMGDVEQAVEAHDHFGIPAGMTAELRQQGGRPLVALDAILAR